MNKLILFQGESSSGKTTTLRQLILDLEREITDNSVPGKIVPLNADIISPEVRADLIKKGSVLLFSGSNDETRMSDEEQDWCAIFVTRGRVVVISTGGDAFINYFKLFLDLLKYLISLQELADFVLVGVLAVTDNILKENTDDYDNTSKVKQKIQEIRNTLKRTQSLFFSGQVPEVFKSTKIHLKRGPASREERERIAEQCTKDVGVLKNAIFQDESLECK
ncbi:MAG: hypothetical protein ACI4RT_08815 [Candidatus Spyradenecus sp.]